MSKIDVTEKSSEREMSDMEARAKLFKDLPLDLDEKLLNPCLFMRRQELSYILADYEIFKLIQNIKGSIFYFGVFHGAGFMNWCNLSSALEPFNHTRELIGFDTWTGYPEITAKDKMPNQEFHTLVKGGFNSNVLEQLKERIKLYDNNRPLNHIPKVKLIKGDMCKTLPKYMKDNPQTVIALAIYTINLYEPSKVGFEEVWKRMPKGGILLVRSLNENVYPGITHALFDVLGDKIRINTFPFAPNLAYVIKE